MVFQLKSVTDTSRASFVLSFFFPSFFHYPSPPLCSRWITRSCLMFFSSSIDDCRKSSDSPKLLTPSKQMNQINVKPTISNIYKICPLIPTMFESGILQDLLSHDCIMGPSVRLLATGKESN